MPQKTQTAGHSQQFWSVRQKLRQKLSLNSTYKGGPEDTLSNLGRFDKNYHSTLRTKGAPRTLSAILVGSTKTITPLCIQRGPPGHSQQFWSVRQKLSLNSTYKVGPQDTLSNFGRFDKNYHSTLRTKWAPRTLSAILVGSTKTITQLYVQSGPPGQSQQFWSVRQKLSLNSTYKVGPQDTLSNFGRFDKNYHSTLRTKWAPRTLSAILVGSTKAITQLYVQSGPPGHSQQFWSVRQKLSRNSTYKVGCQDTLSNFGRFDKNYEYHSTLRTKWAPRTLSAILTKTITQLYVQSGPPGHSQQFWSVRQKLSLNSTYKVGPQDTLSNFGRFNKNYHSTLRTKWAPY